MVFIEITYICTKYSAIVYLGDTKYKAIFDYIKKKWKLLK